jgi:GntR family transcriptional repressor for pyruvate dehydrogenase complex
LTVNISLESVKQGRVSDGVREQITNLILAGELNVGDRLPTENELARQLGVSKVPVREAMISLQQMGLLTSRRGAGGGVFVCEPRPEPVGEALTLMLRLGKASIADLTQARLVIEPHVARQAALLATARDVARLEESIIEYQKIVEQNQERSIRDLDFHLTLADACGNPVFNLILRALIPLLYTNVRLRRLPPERRNLGIDGHREILEAVRRGDPEKAQLAMARHVTQMATLWK